MINSKLVDEAKKYLPRCHYVDGKYSISKRQKGLHSERVVMSLLVEKKIQKVLDNYPNAINVNFSKSTKSVYFEIESTSYRISNHTKDFEGEQIIIKWDTELTLNHGN